MPRVVIYSKSPPLLAMATFAAHKAVPEPRELNRATDRESALALLEKGPYELAILEFIVGDGVVEAYTKAGIPTLVGICVDTPELEVLARQEGATECWQWPMQMHLLQARIENLLAC